MARRSAAALLLLAVACASTAPPVEPTPKSGWRRAPPKPGSSITHTKLCECRSCEPRRCCGGEATRRAEASCGDGYDFSREGCGLDVASCTSRCTKHVWRVPLAASCGDDPPECC